MPAYKDNVTGKWFAKFYCKNWRGENRQIKKRGFDTKREALEYERHYKIREEENLDMTFGDFFKLYSSDMEVRLKHNTWLSKEHVVRTKILPFFKDMKMNEISPSDIVKWQNEMIAFRYENGKGYSETYRKTMYNQLSCIFNHACRFYGLKVNPARLAGNMGKEETKEMLFWTKDEYQKFSEAIMENEVAFYAFEMLYWTGIRCGELLALTMADFDETACTVRINKSYQRLQGKDFITTPKTKKTEEKPMVTETDCKKMPSDESSSDLFISTFIDDQKEKASMLTDVMSESSKEIAAVDETEDMKEETHYFSDYYNTDWLDQAAISNADEPIKEQEESLQNEKEKIASLSDAYHYDGYKDIKKAGHGGEGKDEPKESGGLPARYSDFMKLSYAEKADRLCKPGEDADNILYLLQEYAQSVGHKFQYFDDLMEEAEQIRKAFDERNAKGETEKIVDRLASSGITARNFMGTDSRKIAACFNLAEVSLDEVSKQFSEVVRRIGVRADQQELFQKFMEVYDRISKTADRIKELDKQEKRWSRDSRGR